MASLKDEAVDRTVDVGDTSIPAIHTQATAIEATASVPATDVTRSLYNLPSHITLDSGYSQIWKVMKKMHKGEETDVWSNMANCNGHATWLNALLEPGVKHLEPVAEESGKKRKADIDPTSGAESEDNVATNQPKKKKRRRGKRGSGSSRQSQKLEEQPMGQEPRDASPANLNGREPSEEGELPEDKGNQSYSGLINGVDGVAAVESKFSDEPHEGAAGNDINASVYGANDVHPPTESGNNQAESTHQPEVEIHKRVDDSEEEGAIRVSSDDEPPRPPPNPKRRRTEQVLESKRVGCLLAHVDVSIWSSLQRKFVCSGNDDPNLGFALPKLDIQAIADTVEAGYESQDAYNQLGYVETPCDKLQLIPTGELNGFIIYDTEGIPIVAHFPRAIRTYSKDSWNKSLVKLRRKTTSGESSMDSQGKDDGLHSKEENVKQEDEHLEVHKDDMAIDLNQKRRTFRRFPTGTLHLSFSWKSLYNDKDYVDQSSNCKATGSGSSTHFVAVQEHYKEVSKCMMFQNYVLYKIASKGFQSHLKLRDSLHKRFVAIGVAGANSPSLFSSRTYVYNEPAKVQFREEDAVRGWTLLALAGTCDTGRLAFPGLGVKFDYRPGDLTFTRGRLIKCGVVDWEGDGNHILTVNSNHYTEWEMGEVQPVW